MMKKVIFVTGIDTNIGKSFVTGYLAAEYMAEGFNVITQKLVQTGSSGISEDIKIHRKIMGIDLLPEDINGTTCPIVLSYPASPHLAAQIDNVKIDMRKIRNATDTLKKKYDVVLIEGTGGIMTPLVDDYTVLNYIREYRYPVIIVTTPRLGSINHTLLTLEMCRLTKVEIGGIVYNRFNGEDNVICEDTKQYLKDYLEKYSNKSMWIEINNGVLKSWGLE
jgi:dethiobiotin synthetase